MGVLDVFKIVHMVPNRATRLVYITPIHRKTRYLESYLHVWWSLGENSTRIKRSYPANIYLLIVNNRNTRTRCKICSKLTRKTPEWRQNMFKVNKKDTRTPVKRRQWRRFDVFIVNFEYISHLVLVFLLLTFAGWVNYLRKNFHYRCLTGF